MLVTTSPLMKTYTLEEFWAIPEPDDRSKLELINGVLYASPPPNEFLHDPVTGKLNVLLGIEIGRLNWPGLLYSARAGIWTRYPHTYVEPDLFFLTNESIAYFETRPRTSADIAFEALSPETARYDRTTKADTYAALGVKELWLVDPTTRSIEVRYGGDNQWVETRVFRGAERVISKVLPGLQIETADMFADLRETPASASDSSPSR